MHGGKPLATTGSLADTLGVRNPFRYRGYVYDEESGLYYLRSRYFNPVVVRFLNADNTKYVFSNSFSHNLYSYCSNSPIQCSDSDGNAFGWLLWTAIEAVAETAFVFAAEVVLVSVVVTGALLAVGYGVYKAGEAIENAIDTRIHNAKGHQGNMRDTSLRDLSDDAIENELKDPHISKERKAQLQREQKARGLRNRRKRAGYNHHFAPIDMIN